MTESIVVPSATREYPHSTGKRSSAATHEHRLPDRERLASSAERPLIGAHPVPAHASLLQSRSRSNVRCQRWYHTFMDKTTIYLPAELKSAIKRVARRRGVSEADVIRDSIRNAVGGDRPRPRGGLFASRSPIAREADAHLPGFGER